MRRTQKANRIDIAFRLSTSWPLATIELDARCPGVTSFSGETMSLSLSHPRKLGTIAFVAGVTCIVWCLFAVCSESDFLYVAAILAFAFALTVDFSRRKKIESIETELNSNDATSVRRIVVNGIQVGTLPAREVAELKLSVLLDPAMYVSQLLSVGKTLLHGALATALVVPALVFWQVLIDLWIDPHHVAQIVSLLGRAVQSLASHGAMPEVFDLFVQSTQRCVAAIWMITTAALTTFWPARYIPNVFRNRFHSMVRQLVNCPVDGTTQVCNH
jgi:hypothetical protein